MILSKANFDISKYPTVCHLKIKEKNVSLTLKKNYTYF